MGTTTETPRQRLRREALDLHLSNTGWFLDGEDLRNRERNWEMSLKPGRRFSVRVVAYSRGEQTRGPRRRRSSFRTYAAAIRALEAHDRARRERDETVLSAVGSESGLPAACADPDCPHPFCTGADDYRHGRRLSV